MERRFISTEGERCFASCQEKKEVSLKEPLGEMLQLPPKRKTPVDFQHVVLGEDLTRQGKARPGEVRQGKAKQGKAKRG